MGVAAVMANAVAAVTETAAVAAVADAVKAVVQAVVRAEAKAARMTRHAQKANPVAKARGKVVVDVTANAVASAMTADRANAATVRCPHKAPKGSRQLR